MYVNCISLASGVSNLQGNLFKDTAFGTTGKTARCTLPQCNCTAFVTLGAARRHQAGEGHKEAAAIFLQATKQPTPAFTAMPNRKLLPPAPPQHELYHEETDQDMYNPESWSYSPTFEDTGEFGHAPLDSKLTLSAISQAISPLHPPPTFQPTQSMTSSQKKSSTQHLFRPHISRTLHLNYSTTIKTPSMSLQSMVTYSTQLPGPSTPRLSSMI